MKNITYDKFYNLLCFCCLIGHSKAILDMSPDYLVEKYSIFFNSVENIKDKNKSQFLHKNLITELVDKYLVIWSDDIDAMKRVDKINKIV